LAPLARGDEGRTHCEHFKTLCEAEKKLQNPLPSSIFSDHHTGSRHFAGSRLGEKMRKSALLLAAGFAMLAPSMAQAQKAAYPPPPCCQDTIKLFWRGAEAWNTAPAWKPYEPVAWKPYTPPPAGTPACCQDTIKLIWRGVDAWTGWQPATNGRKRK
jgi:hypothetical protein